MIAWMTMALLFIQQPSAADPLSEDARAAIAPVIEVIRTEQMKQAASAPADLNERFLRMYRLDQDSRKALQDIDLSGLPDDQRQVAERVMWEAIEAVDQQNQEDLLELIPPEGWFYKSIYGEGPAQTAFLIIQHSNVDLWRRFLPILEPLVATGEVRGESYGLMYDRLAINEGRPQRYGTQMTCKAGKFVIDQENLEDPENVEDRRRAMGFRWTLSEYQALFDDYPPCREN